MKIFFLRSFRLPARGALLAGALGLVGAPVAHANPSGEQVVAGSAAFARSGNTLQIHTSDRVIINWQDFSIHVGELTRFIQPGADSAALNRVISGNPSSLLGALQANGRIYLINPNGIMVGGGATINCGAFIASTLDINNTDFLAGGDLRLVGDSTAAIVNQGRISASGGDIFLIARQVDNRGTLSAPDGVVGLAAGREVLLKEGGAERLFVRPATPEGAWSLNGVHNAGTIEAAQAELKAHGNIYAFAINNEGVIRATGVDLRDGRVLLTAADGLVKNAGMIEAESPSSGAGHTVAVQARSIQNPGRISASGLRGGRVELRADYIDQSGEVSANGTAGDGGSVRIRAEQRLLLPAAGVIAANGAGEGNGGAVEATGGGTMLLSGKVQATSENGVGGAIHLTAPRLGLAAAEADASGGAGGGEILLGGGAHGDGPILNSQYTLVNPYATVRADATSAGDGGKVVVWSDGETDFQGTISARGGPGGGNGGWVEVSGLGALGYAGRVDAAAPAGAGGVLLLDPKNITVMDTPLNPWYLAFTLTKGSPADGDRFGAAIASLGSALLVGVPNDDSAATDAGIAYVYSENGTLLATLNDPSAVAYGNFGVAAAGVNGLYAIGAPGNMYGKVYLFDGAGNVQTTIHNPNMTPGDAFGSCLAALGPDKLLVGAPNTTVAGFSGAGKVYGYDTGGYLGFSLDSPVPSTGAMFGRAIAGSIDTFLVGAPFDSAHDYEAGRVFLFDDSGAYLREFLTPLEYGDHFGFAVALQGGTPVIGAPGRTVNGASGAGMVFVFQGDDGGLLYEIENPEPDVGDHFGAAIQHVGNSLVVGTPDDSFQAAGAGAVYIFDGDMSGGSYGELRMILRDPKATGGDHFGLTLVSVGANPQLIVGAPMDHSMVLEGGAVYAFREIQGTSIYDSAPQISLLRSPAEADAGFGTTVAAVDSSLVVGAPRDSAGASAAGAVYVFDGFTGGLENVLNNPDPVADDHFGQALADAGDGMVLVGAPNKQVGGLRSGAAYLFSTGDILPAQTFVEPSPASGDQFGFALAAFPWEGNTAIIGAPGAAGGGVVHLFSTFDGAHLQEISNPGAPGDRFGQSVAFAGGSLVAIGAPLGYGGNPGAGIVYVYRAWDGTPYRTLISAASAANGNFGVALAYGGQNAALAIGAPGEDAGKGLVHMMDVDAGAEFYQITNPSGASGEDFGKALALDAEILLVGAPNAASVGKAYGFELADSSFVRIFSAPTPMEGDGFGQSVTLFHGAAVHRTPLDQAVAFGAGSEADGMIPGAGAAYLFQRTAAGIPFREGPDADLVIRTSEIEDLIYSGISLFLQANNDITIQDPIFAVSEGDLFGDFVLQAGRSVFLKADIVADVSRVEIVANAGVNDGVNSAFRDSGAAVIEMDPDVTLAAGNADVLLKISDGLGLANRQSGNITLANITADNLAIVHLGPDAAGSVLPADAAALLQTGGIAFQVMPLGGSVGAAATPIQMVAANLDVQAPSGGAFFNLPYGDVMLGNSAPGAFLGLNGLEVAGSGPFQLSTTYGNVASDANATFLLPGTVTIAAIAGDLILGNSAAVLGTLELQGGHVTVVQSGIATFGNSAVTGDLSVDSAGVAQVAPVSVQGGASFKSSAPVILTDPDNGFFGTVSFDAADQSVRFRNNNWTTDLGRITAASLEVTATGEITDSDTLTVANLAKFDSDTADLTLDNDFSTFGSLDLKGHNLTVYENDAMQLAGIWASGNLNVTANGPITQSGAIVANGDGTTATFNADTSHDLALNHSDNDFATVAIVAGNNVTLRDANALDLGASTVSGNLSVAANGPITQSGAIVANGNGTTAYLTASAGYDITLDDVLNDWNTVRIISGNQVTLRDANNLDLGASTISGDLVVDAGGVLVQSGALNVAGRATFGTTGPYIRLLNVLNVFLGPLAFSGTAAEGGYVEVLNSTDTQLDGFSVANDFALAANGMITQLGALIVPGTASFDASGHDIALDDPMNSFGALALNGANVSARTYDSMVLASAFATGVLDLQSFFGGVDQLDSLGAETLRVSAMGPVQLDNSGNRIGVLDNISAADGAVEIYDGAGGLSVQGNIQGGASPGDSVTIRTAGGDLALDTGAALAANNGNDLRLVTDQGFKNYVGADVLTLSDGGRFLIYAGASSVNELNGLISAFTEYGVNWPTAPQEAHTGNGVLLATATPPPPPPLDNTQEIINTANNTTSTFTDNTSGNQGNPGGTLFASLVGGASSGGNVGDAIPGGNAAGGDGGALASGSSLDNTEETGGGGPQAQGGTGGTGGAGGTGGMGGTTDPANDHASVSAGGGMRLGAQGLNSMGFQQVPPTLQRAISLQIRSQLQSAIGNF
ncbi:MAG: filamentous hemagglutinin N-terminal domain-containing protein [Verrucomicrobiae bacterium]|nr:filamentous hemagglutinin N-terminal domain-containing protein [Verrucomicrobiae bacterium]